MKKKLEAELISIAHRVLKLKNKDDVRELHHETQKLYEKLSVLLFVEENFDEVKPTIGLHDIEAKLEKAFDFDEKIVVAEIKENNNHEFTIEDKIQVNNTVSETNTIEKEVEKIVEEIKIEEKKEETKVNQQVETTEVEETVGKQVIEDFNPVASIEDKKQVLFEDLLGGLQPDLIFDRVSEKSSSNDVTNVEIAHTEAKIETEVFSDTKKITGDKPSKKSSNLNEKLTKGITIGLNDRIAFEKNLFGGSSEDFNRVISQLSTLDTLEDAKNFIDEMVKPDYNNWEGKDEFVSRFMEFVENKFV